MCQPEFLNGTTNVLTGYLCNLQSVHFVENNDTKSRVLIKLLTTSHMWLLIYKKKNLTPPIENIEIYIAIQPKNIGISYFAHILQP